MMIGTRGDSYAPFRKICNYLEPSRNGDRLWTGFFKTRIVAAFRREDAPDFSPQSARKAAGISDRLYLNKILCFFGSSGLPGSRGFLLPGLFRGFPFLFTNGFSTLCALDGLG
jgi:hypothetical protein